MKQLEKTDEISNMLRRAVGPDANIEELAVYEATALNTLPLRKRHPLFNKAIVGEDALYKMADLVNKESIPLHVQHNSEPLPIGRVFAGRVVQLNGALELRAWFFLPKTHQEQIDLIESGTVDQVSVSVLHEKILCSKCGFNYMGDEATFSNILDGTCPDGHVLGENGVHAKLIGVENWFELSLVGMGGAQNARIRSKSNSVISARLQADGKDISGLLLETEHLGSKIMDVDLTKFITELSDGKVALTLAQNQVTDLTAKLEAATTRVAELEAAAANPPAEVTELQTQLGATQAELTKATDFLKDLAQKTATATGLKFEGETIEDMITSIQSAHDKLKSLIPVGGLSHGADAGDNKTRKLSSATGFMIRK